MQHLEAVSTNRDSVHAVIMGAKAAPLRASHSACQLSTSFCGLRAFVTRHLIAARASEGACQVLLEASSSTGPFGLLRSLQVTALTRQDPLPTHDEAASVMTLATDEQRPLKHVPCFIITAGGHGELAESSSVPGLAAWEHGGAVVCPVPA